MLTSFLTLLSLGCLTGITTVLFGFGGGFITVPVVYGVLTMTARPGADADAMHIAVATSAAVMVVNAAAAALAQWRQGRLRREYVWPLTAFIAVGAVAGAFATTLIGGTALRLLFAAYLLITIADSLLRKGFLSVAQRTRPQPLERRTVTFGGVGIGLVAAGLGVGGSVMTVPLLRRRGLPMAEATAMANPSVSPSPWPEPWSTPSPPPLPPARDSSATSTSPRAPRCSSAHSPPSRWPDASPAGSRTGSTPSRTSRCSWSY